METLQLREIAAYMPFLKLLFPNGDIEYMSFPHLTPSNNKYFAIGKPLLRPMHDLIKPLPDGTIPIIQMAKLVNDDPEGSDPNNWFEWDNVRLATRGVFGDVYSVFSRHDEMIFRINTKNMHMDMSEDGEDVTACPYTDKIFDYLHEHMFDYRGLIHRGLAIDLNSVNEK